MRLLSHEATSLNNVAGLHLLQLANESLDQSISLINKLLESLIQFVLFEQVDYSVAGGAKVHDLGLLLLDLGALTSDDLFEADGVLRGALILKLLHQVLKFLHSLHKLRSVDGSGALDRFFMSVAIPGQVEKFELVPMVLKLQM